MLVSCGADGLLVFRQLSPGESHGTSTRRKTLSVFLMIYFSYRRGACSRGVPVVLQSKW